MSAFLKKHSILVSIFLILILFAATWLFPSIGMLLLIISLGIGLVLNAIQIFRKHREAHLQGRISHFVFIRNVFLEISGIVIIMVLAGLTGNYIARLATRQIDSTLVKFIAGLVIGLVVGMTVGFLVKRTWNGFKRMLNMQ